jgi:hypothetical protein
MTSNIETFREGVTWFQNSREWAKEQRDEAIELATNNLGVSTLNARFGTLCEISSNDSAVSITEQSYFLFNATDTPEESLQSESSKRSQRKHDD